MARGPADMYAAIGSSTLRGLEDRPIAFAADRLAGAGPKLDLHESRIAGVALDFGHRGSGVVMRDLDRCLQPIFSEQIRQAAIR